MHQRLKICVYAALAALGGLLCSSPLALAQQDKGPIKIGFMAPYVGVYTKLGTDMERGFRLYLEQVGYKAGGRKLTVVTEDTEAKPELGPTKVRKLIENEKVDLLAGIVHSGVAYAVRDIVDGHKIPLVITNAGAPGLTQEKKSPYIFRVSFTNAQSDLVGGWYAYNKAGIKRVIMIAADYSAGHDKADGFKKFFVGSGGKVVEEIYPPLTTNDFGPYLSRIADKTGQTDAVWMFFSGSGAIRLINQYQEYGFKGRIPLFVQGDTVDDIYFPSMKDAALGAMSYLHYAPTVDTPENHAFVKAYEARYKEKPWAVPYGGYLGAKAIVKALDAVNGDIENKGAFLAAMRKVKFRAPAGPFAFDKDQNVIINVFIRKVVKTADGGYENKVLETIPNVSQYWTPADLNR